MNKIKIMFGMLVMGLYVIVTPVCAEDMINVGNTICPVSGQEIGSMGDDYLVNHEGKEYNLCCKGCARKFYKNPEKYMSEEMEKQGHSHAGHGHSGHAHEGSHH